MRVKGKAKGEKDIKLITNLKIFSFIERCARC